ncbi:MAG: hypothetical protein VX672_05710, partial [Planctomycetota bacterium]|nr:hypothetical protein [Planctomycetota bacterium]
AATAFGATLGGQVSEPRRSNVAPPTAGVDRRPEVAGASLSFLPSPDGDIRFDAAPLNELRPGDVVLIGVPGGAVDRFRCTATRHEANGDRWWTFTSLEDSRGMATIAGRGGILSGFVRSWLLGDGFDWEFPAVGPGRMRPMPVPMDGPGCGGVIDPPNLEEPMLDRRGGRAEADVRSGPSRPGTRGEPVTRAAAAGEDEAATCTSCLSAVADLAFFYTPQVLEFVEDRLEDNQEDPALAVEIIRSSCVLECANTTLAFTNSELPFAVRLVGLEPVVWEDEYDAESLGLFAGEDDGVMDEVHARRVMLGADACSLITLTDGRSDTDDIPDETGVSDEGSAFGGIAFLGNGISPGLAFNQLLWRSMGDGFLLAHEFGHNLGCGHAAGDCFDCTPTCDDIGFGCCRPEETGPDSKLPGYAFGWRWVNVGAPGPACRRTVMAYGPGVMEPHFSNPEVEIDGALSGSPEDDPDNRWADNARRIRETFPGTAGFFCEAPEAQRESGRLVAPSIEEFDGFGTALATDGIRMFVGASRHDALDINSGSVFAFANRALDLPNEIPEGWSEVRRIIPEGLEQGDLFGESLAVQDELLVVGAPYAARVVTEIVDGEEIEVERHPLAGKAEIWARYGEIDDPLAEFCRIATLQPETLEANDLFGASVAIVGDLVAVGAPLVDRSESELNVGRVYLFQREDDDTFSLIEVFEGVEAGDRFGSVVALTPIDDVNLGLVVGTPWSDSETGLVQPYALFETNGEYVVYQGEPRLGAQPGDRFGAALAADGGTVVVGAPNARGTTGAASVYRLDFGELTDEAPLFVSSLEAEDRFGASVACRGGRIAVGMPGRDKMSPDDPEQVLLDDVGGCVFY